MLFIIPLLNWQILLIMFAMLQHMIFHIQRSRWRGIAVGLSVPTTRRPLKSDGILQHVLMDSSLISDGLEITLSVSFHSSWQKTYLQLQELLRRLLLCAFDVRFPDCQMDLCVHVHADCRRSNRSSFENMSHWRDKKSHHVQGGPQLHYCTIPSYPAYDSGEDETTFKYRVCTAKKRPKLYYQTMMRDKLPSVEPVNPTTAISNIVIHVIGTWLIWRA